jgi:hypothetical protein
VSGGADASELPASAFLRQAASLRKRLEGEVRLPTEKTWLVGAINDQKNSRQKKIAWQPCPTW